MVGATLLGLIEERAPGRLQTTLFNLLALRRPTLEPWSEVVVGGGEESHDGDTRETPPTTPTSLLAETSLKKTPPEGLDIRLHTLLDLGVGNA